jgi:hypothetical protein
MKLNGSKDIENITFAAKLNPPNYSVFSTNIRKSVEDCFGLMEEEMVNLAKKQPCCLLHKSPIKGIVISNIYLDFIW